MKDWIENTGQFYARGPDVPLVDIKLNDSHNSAMQDGVWLAQDVRGWDWQRSIGGIEITHFRESDQP